MTSPLMPFLSDCSPLLPFIFCVDFTEQAIYDCSVNFKKKKKKNERKEEEGSITLDQWAL